jgi:CheY-like chemotaxis protein
MKKILVVDDNKDITEMVKEMLELSGYSCTTVNSGQACLSELRDNKFDLVLLDLAMPEVAGIDVLTRVKEDSTLRDNRIVFFTASSVTDTEIEYLKKEGGLDCIRKPITIDKLLYAIEKHSSCL